MGLVLGDVFDKALGDRKGIKRFGHAVTPMDDALSCVAADLSKRPFLIYNVPQKADTGGSVQVEHSSYESGVIRGDRSPSAP